MYEFSVHLLLEKNKRQGGRIMSQKRADAILLFVAIIWGSSYLLAKLSLTGMGVFNLMALRFGIAFFVTAAIFIKKVVHTEKETIKKGAILGATLGMFFALQYFGLRTTTASCAGFLTSTAVVFIVVFQTLIQRKLPKVCVLLGSIVTLCGIGFLTLNGGFSIEPGALLCLLGAMVYAIHIILTNRFVKSSDGIGIGIMELGFCGLYSFILSLLTEGFMLPVDSKGWVAVLGMGIGCSAIGFILQPLALKYTTSERAGILLSIEPLCSAIYAFLFFHELLSRSGIFGAILIMIGVFMSGMTVQPKLWIPLKKVLTLKRGWQS